MQIEGRNAVQEALKNEKNIDKVMVQKGASGGSIDTIVANLKKKNVKVQFFPKDVLDAQSLTRSHQGIIAFVTDFKYCELSDIMNLGKDGEKLVIVLDGINDPHNFGSIIRSAECMGVNGIVIGKNRCVPVTETVVKVSEGATEHMKIAKVTNVNDAIKTLKENNYWAIAAEADGSDMEKTNLTGNVALVIGSEGSGVSVLTKKLCDSVVKIKMFGKLNSLNAGVATGITLYEINRQRGAK